MRCAVCGSEKLTPPGALMTGHGNVGITWKLSGETGWFSSAVGVSSRLGVLCGDCGYVMLFVVDLQEVREKWSQLVPAEPS